MLFSRINYSFVFLISVFCLGCTTKEKERLDNRASEFVVIDNNFTSVNLNSKVLITTDFRKTDLNRKDLRNFLLKSSKPTNNQSGKVMVGEYHQYPDAWFSTQLINTTNNAINLVVDEDNHLRCDGIEVITFKGDSITNWGSMVRETPYSKRQIPFYSFAIPITIDSKDTLNLLIHTNKKYGFQEVNLNIARTSSFWSKTLNKFFLQLLIIVGLTLCTLIMCIIGWIFRDKLMTNLGYYLLAVTLLLMSSMGINDTFGHIPYIGLSATGLASPLIFVVNAMYHPYGMELMKPVPKNEKRFKTISKTLIIVNLLIVCCYFIPLDLFRYIDLYLPPTMSIMALINIFWIFYSAIIANLRAKIKYFLVAVSFAFLPFLLEQVSNVFFHSRSPIMLKYNQWSFAMAVVGICIVTLFQLKEKLISRKIHKNNLSQLKETMEDIRNNEVNTIGRNLHDNVGKILATALGYLNLKHQNKETLENLINEAIKEIRFLSHNLVKNEDLPIVIKIERLAEHFNEFSDINYEFSDYSQGLINQLSPEKQTNLFYIIQELFTNTLKHSFAKEVVIQIFMEKERIWISVEDDGIGLKKSGNTEGIGLENIKKRAEISGFEIRTDSSSNGTNTTIEFKI